MQFEMLPDGKHIRLTAEVIQATPIGTIVVPPGFVTDGASIPRWAWPIFGPPIGGKHLKAAVIHDWLCEQAIEANDYPTRILADVILLMVLYRTPGIPKWKRTAMYLTVRWWGKLAFKKVAK